MQSDRLFEFWNRGKNTLKVYDKQQRLQLVRLMKLV